MIILLAVLAVVMVVMVADSPIGRALAARLEGRSGDPLSDRRLAHLEAEVDRLSRELQRLDDESAFLHRLLEEKRAPDALPPSDTDD